MSHETKNICYVYNAQGRKNWNNWNGNLKYILTRYILMETNTAK